MHVPNNETSPEELIEHTDPLIQVEESTQNCYHCPHCGVVGKVGKINNLCLGKCQRNPSNNPEGLKKMMRESVRDRKFTTLNHLRYQEAFRADGLSEEDGIIYMTDTLRIPQQEAETIWMMHTRLQQVRIDVCTEIDDIPYDPD